MRALSYGLGFKLGFKFVGTGERLEALEPFYPDRTASRILGARALLGIRF